MEPSAPEMSCEELVELVTDHWEGSLSRAQRERFNFHLGRCPGCREYLDQLRTSVSMLGRLREPYLAPGVKAALLEAFRDWKLAK
jgi:predicted anti-sigma-YlaC factor YlaD